MEDHKILLTGDFWHQDFQGIVSSFDVPVTLVPIEKVDMVADSKFDLVVLAESRRNQFFAEQVEKIQGMFSQTPVIGLLGSWCEGEARSGTPFPGVTRVYWHQWQGRYERFVEQLSAAGMTSWHAPRTSSVADQITANTGSPGPSCEIEYVGVSAWTRVQHDMLADVIKHFGWQPRWVERAMWDAESVRNISAICVEADSWCEGLQNRVKWIRSEVPDTPIVLVLNYPRASEIEEIRAAGVADVVSKPFELNDLRSAIVRSADTSARRNLAS